MRSKTHDSIIVCFNGWRKKMSDFNKSVMIKDFSYCSKRNKKRKKNENEK